MTLLVERGVARPDDAAILRTIEYREEAGTRLLVNLPPYPAKAPKEIETGEETLARIVAALEATPPPRAGRCRSGRWSTRGWGTRPSGT